MSAVISPCGRYRYRLGRDLPASLEMVGTCLFIMLNPSTADAEKDDPTIRKCMAYAARWGFARLEVVNLFAWRATDPVDVLSNLADANTCESNRHLREAAEEAGMVVCAWGKGIPRKDGAAATRERAAEVMEILKLLKQEPHCLGLTKGGAPLHPLYLKGDLKPERFP